MTTKAEIHERDHGGKVEIQLPNGCFYRISWQDNKDEIKVQTVDGSMSIHPSVSNEITITTNT